VVTEVNQIFLSAMGYTRDEVVGKHHRMFVEEKEARRPEYEAFWRALGEGVAQQGEFKRVAKNGATVWLSSTYTPIISPSGRTIKIVKYARVTTGEVMRNADFEGQIGAIRRSQAVVTFSRDSVILEANDLFLETMGYSREEVVSRRREERCRRRLTDVLFFLLFALQIGKKHRMFVDDMQSPVYVEFWKALREGHARSGEFRRVGKNGREVFLRAVYTPIVVDGIVTKIIKASGRVGGWSRLY
jgi:methyl-accepting chemotaxis protein